MARVPEISTIKHAERGAYGGAKTQQTGVLGFINIPLVITIILLVGLGLLVVYYAVLGNPKYSFNRQALGVAIGAVAMVVIWAIDYRKLSGYSTLLLIINVVLILSPLLPIIGVTELGGTHWVKIFGVQIQPAEFAKITFILLAASVISRYNGTLDNRNEYLKSLGILLIPFVCVLIQGDLGTGLVFLFIVAIALIVGGARVKFLLITLAVAIGLLFLLLGLDELLKNSLGEYKLLKPYQRGRLLVFIDQNYATAKEGYNLNQAKIAIGSGGLFGKGFMNASQSTMGFLPEAPTDFIFCVLAEMLGFMGVVLLLALYISLVVISFRIARGTNDLFGMLIVMCIVGMWLFQILENIGMTCGLMPITGIPLPFISYGSSFMLANFMLLGLVGSVWLRSH